MIYSPRSHRARIRWWPHEAVPSWPQSSAGHDLALESPCSAGFRSSSSSSGYRHAQAVPFSSVARVPHPLHAARVRPTRAISVTQVSPAATALVRARLWATLPGRVRSVVTSSMASVRSLSMVVALSAPCAAPTKLDVALAIVAFRFLMADSAACPNEMRPGAVGTRDPHGLISPERHSQPRTLESCGRTRVSCSQDLLTLSSRLFGARQHPYTRKATSTSG